MILRGLGREIRDDLLVPWGSKGAGLLFAEASCKRGEEGKVEPEEPSLSVMFAGSRESPSP
jgi:hypothetical protein